MFLQGCNLRPCFGIVRPDYKILLEFLCGKVFYPQGMVNFIAILVEQPRSQTIAVNGHRDAVLGQAHIKFDGLESGTSRISDCFKGIFTCNCLSAAVSHMGYKLAVVLRLWSTTCKNQSQ